MKKMLALMLALLMTFSLFGCKQQEPVNPTQSQQTEPEVTQPEATQPEITQPQDEPVTPGTATPLLYRVSDEKGNVVWLFGSIHVGREDYYPLPDYVMDAYNSSDALAVELDIVESASDIAGQMEQLQKLMYLDGTTISDHIPEDIYNGAVAIMEDANMYMSALDYYMPVIWWSFLQNIITAKMGAQTELGIDMHFLELAKDSKKEILEVESMEFQYEMMVGFSEELQIYLLTQMVDAYAELEVSLEDLNLMMDLWASGDENAINDYLNREQEFESEKEKELYQEYNYALTVSRNQSMTQWAEEALSSGKEVFIVVGAAHVVGDGAMAENLRELGYTVELIVP